MIDTLLFNSIWILPLLTTLICIPIGVHHSEAIKRIHLGSAFVVLGIALYLTIKTFLLANTAINSTGSTFSLNFVTQFSWWKTIGAEYFVV